MEEMFWFLLAALVIFALFFAHATWRQPRLREEARRIAARYGIGSDEYDGLLREANVLIKEANVLSNNWQKIRPRMTDQRWHFRLFEYGKRYEAYYWRAACPFLKELKGRESRIWGGYGLPIPPSANDVGRYASSIAYWAEVERERYKIPVRTSAS